MGIEIPVSRLHDSATLPTKAHPDDAGWDLYADVERRICPGEYVTINTGIRMAIPRGFYGRIAPRSGIAVDNGIDNLAGVVDSGYRGEIRVVLINLGNEDFYVSRGDRIAQMIIEVAPSTALTEVDNLPEAGGRGSGGFGSSGMT